MQWAFTKAFICVNAPLTFTTVFLTSLLGIVGLAHTVLLILDAAVAALVAVWFLYWRWPEMMMVPVKQPSAQRDGTPNQTS